MSKKNPVIIGNNVIVGHSAIIHGGQVGDDVLIGMGAIRKVSEEIGEIKRMYIQPSHRGRGHGKQMLNKLLEAGREFGFS